MDDSDAYRWLRGELRSEMVRQRISYSDLSERLEIFGVTESVSNLRNKIGRGKFSALFFVQCLEVMGLDFFHLTLLEDLGMGDLKPHKTLKHRRRLSVDKFLADRVPGKVVAHDFAAGDCENE